MNNECRCNHELPLATRTNQTQQPGMALASSLLEAFQRMHRLHELRARLLQASVEDE